jgi:hypothetical protein
MECRVGRDRQYHDVSRLGKPLEERRASRRLPPSEFPEVKSTTIVAGPKVRIVNISRRGILFTSDEPVSPGIKIHLRLVASGKKPVILKGIILRSKLETLESGQPIYHSAVAIDEDFPFLATAESEAGAEGSKGMGADGSPDVEPRTDPQAIGEAETVLTLTALVPEKGPDISQIFTERA